MNVSHPIFSDDASQRLLLFAMYSVKHLLGFYVPFWLEKNSQIFLGCRSFNLFPVFVSPGDYFSIIYSSKFVQKMVTHCAF